MNLKFDVRVKGVSHVFDHYCDAFHFIYDQPYIYEDTDIGFTDGYYSLYYHFGDYDIDIFDLLAIVGDRVKKLNVIDDNGIIISDRTDLAFYLTFLRCFGYKEHHHALTKGYISRKICGKLVTYRGHFGTGFAIFSPTRVSTQYHPITYFVKED